jgi:type I restriction enzyme S subunit
MKWIRFRLDQIATMKYGKMPPPDVLDTEGYPIFSGYRVTGFSKEYLYDASRVVVVARGVGGTGDVKMSPERSWITNLSIVLELDESRVDKNFLFYRLGQEPLKEKLNTGAAQAQITIDSLGSYVITIPEISIQKRISAILSAYDDLIESNRQRMALLEESARILYQEWFVRLRFPGHEHTRIVDGLPEGWERKVLGDLCAEVRDSVLPEKLEQNTPYIGLEHMPRRSIALSEWGKSDQVTSTKHRFREGEILFGKIRPYFHKVGIAFIDGVASSDAIILRPVLDNLHGLVLMTVSSDPFVAEAAQTMREGSKMPRADWKLMRQYSVAIPPEGLLRTFDETICAITDQLKVLTFQNQKLRQARDIFLPRLMNGEIAV